MIIKVSRFLTYTFGAGQTEGIDNVSTSLAVPFTNALTGAETILLTSETVQLPSAGWNEDDVLKALQAKYAEASLEWE